MAATKHIRIVISVDMLSSLTHAVSSMFLNDARFYSNRISMFLSLLTHLNFSSSENILLMISDLTHLEMGVR